MSPTQKIILICTGLGRVNRGFEQYIAGLAHQLSQQELRQTQVEVWTGGHWKMPGVKSRKIANLHRAHFLLSKTAQPFLWEQRSFFGGMLPALLSSKPAAIYLGEYQLYCYLYKLRAALRLDYSLVLYTGGQALPGLFDNHRDFVHHVTNAYIDACKHIPTSRQWLLPHFIHQNFEYDQQAIAGIQKKAAGKKIVLSVGLLDKPTKQMHLLIEAVSKLKELVLLVLLGEESADTGSLKLQMQQQVPQGNYIVQQVPHTQLGNWYRAADLFVLCSPKESFGLAMVEALHHGLPVICRPFTESKFVMQEQANFQNMHNAVELAEAMQAQLQQEPTEEQRQQRQKFVASHYTWQSLGQQYINMFETIATNY
ncbi:MAG TPA: glycosyltransferase [Phnomibacter sp.]|nr:glycosyltransferase [Phnomibacter sp.]